MAIGSTEKVKTLLNLNNQKSENCSHHGTVRFVQMIQGRFPSLMEATNWRRCKTISMKSHACACAFIYLAICLIKSWVFIHDCPNLPWSKYGIHAQIKWSAIVEYMLQSICTKQVYRSSPTLDLVQKDDNPTLFACFQNLQ